MLNYKDYFGSVEGNLNVTCVLVIVSINYNISSVIMILWLCRKTSLLLEILKLENLFNKVKYE